MDLGTDCCYAGVLLFLLTWSLTQGARRMLGIYSCFDKLLACLLAGCLMNEGARKSSYRQAITPAKYDEGTCTTNHNAAARKRTYHITSPP